MMIRAIAGSTLFPVFEWVSGRHVTAQYEALKAAGNEAWEIRKYKNRQRLASIVSFAKANVPYYRNILTKIRFDPLRLLDDPKYLQDIPILTKRDLLEYGSAIISERHKGYIKLQPSHTNGSTGPNLAIYYSPSAKDISAAVTRLTQDWVGYRAHQIQVHLSTRIPNHGDRRAHRIENIRRFLARRESVEFSSLLHDELLRSWEEISSFKPYLVQGLPSQLYAIAGAVKEAHDSQYGHFKVFVSTGETLFPHQRALIEDVFGCRIANRYGSAEFGIIAHEDFRVSSDDIRTSHLMRVVDTHVWVDAYKNLGSGVSPVLITTLNNKAFPLINYTSGDLAEVIERDDGIFISPVQGRIHDEVIIGGKRFSTQFFQDLLSARCGITDFQVIRMLDGAFKIRVVPKSDAKQDFIRGVLTSTFGDKLRVEFCKLAELERVGAQNKFRYVIDEGKADRS
ncbi:hypothetical protein [Rhizobium sp. IMFF44]|uniref:hypothetical protein n=1 Tax=Rhizobium sp. IMFF44 TaxID=3342350 RepID=UPI0035BA74DA